MPSLLRRVAGLYIDGFRNMRVGRQLWALIIIKLIILFAVLKVFFFPDIVRERTPEGADPSGTVRAEILSRGPQ